MFLYYMLLMIKLIKTPIFFLGIITGTVLTILESQEVINVGWLWATFAYWCPYLILLSLYLLLVYIIATITEGDL